MAKNRISTRPETIQKRLSEAIRDKLRSDEDLANFNAKLNGLKESLRSVIDAAVLQTEEYQSLVNGKLRADFGLDDATVEKLPYLLSYLYTLKMQFVPHDDDPTIVFSVDIVVTSISEDSEQGQYGLDAASYVSPRSGELIDWLRWLMFRGTEDVIVTHRVSYREDKGRSHMAIMVRAKDGRTFSVDPNFAGTYGNNFVNKAIKRAESQIIDAIKRYANGSK